MQIKKEHEIKIRNEKKTKTEDKVKSESSENCVKSFTSVEEAIKAHSPSKQMVTTNTPTNQIDITEKSPSYSASNLMNSIKINTDSFFLDRENIKNNFDFIKGEVLIDYDEAFYKNEDISFSGILVMTDFRLLFKFKDDFCLEKLNVHVDYFKVPFFLIIKIEKLHEKKNMVKYTLDITTKDNRQFKFVVSSDQLKFYANLNNLVFPKDPLMHYSFALRYRESLSNEENLTDGWSIYDPLKEYTRQGINFNDNEYLLKATNLNKNYNLCTTYPEMLIVPSSLSDEELREASLYRTKNRFPILSYVYSRDKTGTSYSSIWRSSQTKSGITGSNRSPADEKLLRAICALNNKLVIYDARPYINALANRIKGGGFENVNHYTKTELHFCEIENIHNVRSSMGKIYTLCATSNKITENKKFLSALEQSDWYEFIHLIIKYSNEIANKIKKSYSVLVHCSDGWDRSSQLISLSEILLDPYYRTIEGLIVIIEKEWLSYGHQFALRNGIYLKEHSEDQRAPIFLQWLDCLHQLQVQFPNAFEFNMDLILFLAANYTTNLYGTFLFNSESERKDREAKFKTVSIWADVLSNSHKYKNHFYQPYTGVLNPNYAPYKIRFWEEYFLKWNSSVESSKIILDELNNNVKSSNDFFVMNKIKDNYNLQLSNKKIDELLDVLKDIQNKTKDDPLYDTFSETTKFYLSNINFGNEE